jgi:hypothetical protein
MSKLLLTIVILVRKRIASGKTVVSINWVTLSQNRNGVIHCNHQTRDDKQPLPSHFSRSESISGFKGVIHHPKIRLDVELER